MGLRAKHELFNKSKRKHILMITNHGCHSPIIEVTRDTGGQNFYVNDFCNALLKLGYKITVLNRGGYKHPVTGMPHRGIVYYDRIWGRKGIYCRLIYLEDDEKRFIPKEKLHKHTLCKEKDFFFRISKKINLNLKNIYFISSHYWDGGILGILINKELGKRYGKAKPHIWTPHSLGKLKLRNYKNASKKIVKSLNFPSRIRNEKNAISNVNGVVSTSGKINHTLSKYKSNVKNHFWFPPGIDTNLFKPRKIEQCSKCLKVLGELLGLKRKDVMNLLKTNLVFLEVGRTAKSKQKDIILKSFSMVKNNALLIMTVDKETQVYKNIIEPHAKLTNRNNIILVDRFLTNEEIAQLFSLANIYITASIMEGWGMAVQEAAASKCAVISSKFVPFVTEVLKDNALIVHKNYPRLYAEKIDIMIKEPHLRKKMANKGYRIITNHYSWLALSRKLILNMKKRKIVG